MGIKRENAVSKSSEPRTMVRLDKIISLSLLVDKSKFKDAAFLKIADEFNKAWNKEEFKIFIMRVHNVKNLINFLSQKSNLMLKMHT